MKILTGICDGSFLLAFLSFSAYAFFRLNAAGAFNGVKKVLYLAFCKKSSALKNENVRKSGGFGEKRGGVSGRNGKALLLVGGIFLSVSVAVFCILKGVYYA